MRKVDNVDTVLHSIVHGTNCGYRSMPGQPASAWTSGRPTWATNRPSAGTSPHFDDRSKSGGPPVGTEGHQWMGNISECVVAIKKKKNCVVDFRLLGLFGMSSFVGARR